MIYLYLIEVNNKILLQYLIEYMIVSIVNDILEQRYISELIHNYKNQPTGRIYNSLQLEENYEPLIKEVLSECDYNNSQLLGSIVIDDYANVKKNEKKKDK